MLIFVAAIAGQASAGCRFFQDDMDRVYTVECTSVVVTNENDILDFSAQHEPNRGNSDVRRADFRRSQMETIPSNLFDVFPNLQQLSAVNVGMNRLNVGTLRNCGNLNSLSLINGAISRLDNGVFRNCPSLLQVNMGDNQLNFIGENIFRDTPSLHTVMFHNNRLTELPERIFQNAGYLRQIVFSNNQISRISSNLFRGNPALTWINLAHNQLTEIPAQAFSALRIISLSLNNNLISSIGRGAFGNFALTATRVGNLNLNNNRITRFSSDIFNEVPSNLLSMNIRDNGIVAIERNFFNFVLQTLTVSATGNACVNQDFTTARRETVNAGMERCFLNF